MTQRKQQKAGATSKAKHSGEDWPFVYWLTLTKKIDLELDEFDSREPWAEVEGKIFATHEDHDEPVAVGTVQAQVIHTDDHREVLDAMANLQLDDLYLQLFVPRTSRLRPAIAKLYGRTVLRDPLLYVKEMWIDEEHRGRHLGVKVMEALLSEFAPSITLAFCIPWPLNNMERGGAKPPRRLLKRGKSKLITHWEKAGFEKLGRGPYWCARLGDPL